MTTYNKKKLLIGLFVGLFLAISLFAVSLIGVFNKGTDTALALELDAEIKEVYNLEDEFFMPNAKISNGTTTVDATESYIVFPDNSAKKGSDFVLNQAGLYTLVFAAEVDGKLIRETKDFYVQDVLYQATSNASTIEYKDETFFSKGTRSGLQVGLKDGEQFKYNKPINLKELGKDTPILTMYHENGTELYGEKGSRTMYIQFMYIRLTDCYNPNKYLEIRGRWNSGAIQLQAHQNHQPICGQIPWADGYPGNNGSIFGKNDRMVYIDGIRNWVTYDTSWGSSVGRSDGAGWSFYFNYETKEVEIERGTERKPIVDLDNADIFDDKLFQDFTSNEVYLTIYGNNYQTGVDKFNLEVINIGGEQMTADDSYIDKKGPEIVIDGYDGGIVRVAKDESFKVFDATVLDVNGVKEQKVSAFYNYGTPYQTEIFVKDGKFTPKNIGSYVIEYKATDYFGAESIKTVNVSSVECANNQALSFSVAKQGDVEAGTPCTLETPAISSINGDTYYRVYLLNKNTEEKTLIENNEFIPNDVGAFAIVYEYGDKYTSKEYSYEFKATTSSKVIVTEPTMPKYIMANYYYTFDKATVTSFGTGAAVKTDAKAYVSENGGAYTEINLAKFKVSSTDVTSVKFKFEDTATGTAKESQDVKVINVKNAQDKLAIENYFQGDVTKVANSENVTLTANASSGDVKVDFVNTLTLTNFKLNLVVPNESANFNAIRITLTDFYDRRNVNEFEIVKISNEACRIYHGAGFGAISKAFSGNTFALSYSNGKLVEESGASVTLANEFTSERLLLSIEMVGVNGASAIAVKQIGNQEIKTVNADLVAPEIILKNELSGYAKMGETVKVNKVEVVDVLSPYFSENLTVSVFGAAGKVATSVDGVTLNNVAADRDYEMVLSENVVYKVSYTYADQTGNSVSILSPYESLDVIAPEITLNDIEKASIIEAEVGDTIDIAKFNVTDNCSSIEKIRIIVNVMTPRTEKIYLKGGATTFVPDRAGTYTVKYMALDEVGNYSTTFYYVLVK